jgi:hypothetical protein
MEIKMTSEQVLNELDLLSDKISGEVITNYYLNNFSSGDLTVIKENNSIVVLDKEFDFYRTYFYSDNLATIKSIIGSINNKSLTLEYLSKENPVELKNMLSGIMFKEISVHHKIVNKTLPKLKVNKELTFASTEDVTELYDSLVTNFNKYSDHLPSIPFLENAIKNDNIIIYRNNGKITAYIIFELKGKTSYFGFWFSSQHDNPVIGINLMINLYGILNSKGIKMAYGWVKDDNFKVIEIHKKFGFFFEGSTNYIFMRKA